MAQEGLDSLTGKNVLVFHTFLEGALMYVAQDKRVMKMAAVRALAELAKARFRAGKYRYGETKLTLG